MGQNNKILNFFILYYQYHDNTYSLNLSSYNFFRGQVANAEIFLGNKLIVQGVVPNISSNITRNS